MEIFKANWSFSKYVNVLKTKPRFKHKYSGKYQIFNWKVLIKCKISRPVRGLPLTSVVLEIFLRFTCKQHFFIQTFSHLPLLNHLVPPLASAGQSPSLVSMVVADPVLNRLQSESQVSSLIWNVWYFVIISCEFSKKSSISNK